MSIGVLALGIGAVASLICFVCKLGGLDSDPPACEDKVVRYPFPLELWEEVKE